MTPPNPASEAWAEWWGMIDGLSGHLNKLAARKTTHVTATFIRLESQGVAQFYFRTLRPHLVNLIDKEQIDALDRVMQHLIVLAADSNRTATYRRTIQELRPLRAPVLAALEIRFSAAATAPAPLLLSHVEAAILNTLEKLLPLTALSYRQALQDLADQKRFSYRGVAAEFREVLREVLDHLAPDADVMKVAGFKLEQGQTKPTMKQKAVSILKARGLNETKRRPATDAIAIIEGAVGSLARAAYSRGSLATHVGTERAEVLTFKGYADAVVAELLEIHKS
jgi:Predicted pPIWI-associating nuclease